MLKACVSLGASHAKEPVCSEELSLQQQAGHVLGWRARLPSQPALCMLSSRDCMCSVMGPCSLAGCCVSFPLIRVVLQTGFS